MSAYVGGARLNHLERGEPRAGPHHLARDGFGFSRKDVLLEPLLQAQVVGKPAVQHHRRVAVRVDEAGNDDRAGGVDLLGGLEPRRDVCRRPHGDDGRAIDRDGARVVDIARAVDRDDRAAGDDGASPAAAQSVRRR